MVSDHVAITPDVAEQYPAPFYEPFTTLSLAGRGHRAGPARHHGADRAVPAPVAGGPDGGEPRPAQRRPARARRRASAGPARSSRRSASTFDRRGRLTDEYSPSSGAPGRTTRTTAPATSRSGSAATATAGLRRAVRLGDAWHPLRERARLAARGNGPAARDRRRRRTGRCPASRPRILLRLTPEPLPDDRAGRR